MASLDTQPPFPSSRRTLHLDYTGQETAWETANSEDRSLVSLLFALCSAFLSVHALLFYISLRGQE